MEKRRPWYVRVEGLERLPVGTRKKAMKEIMETCRKWHEEGPDPLVLPSTMQLGSFTDEWEHEVVTLCYLHPDDVGRLIKDYEKDGWQVATSITVPGNNAPMLIFKRPRQVGDEEDDTAMCPHGRPAGTALCPHCMGAAEEGNQP